MEIVNCCWFAGNAFDSWPLQDQGIDELPPVMRRRLTTLGRKVLQVLNKCSATRAEELIPWIISSRYGDTGRRLNLLSNYAQGEMLSPTEFSMSVHNAIIGLYSTTTGNKHLHSALASGVHSFEAGLLESIALLKEKGGAVGYIYYDYLDVDQITGKLEDTNQVECVAMILREGTIGAMEIGYNMSSTNKILSKFNILNFLGFLNNDESRYYIPVGGGEIFFERILSKG